MKWVTRERVHLDRVACPWLITRFIDPAAEFLFVAAVGENDRPADAIPFALPGVELGPHDHDGPTFLKLMRKYQLADPALTVMADIIASGIAFALDQHTTVQQKYPEGLGLNALSEGMIFFAANDRENLEKSMSLFDALYTYCKAKVIESEQPAILQKPFGERLAILKSEIAARWPRK
jgi:hypothetical protein